MAYPIDEKLYSKIHQWLRKEYGKANKCENKSCTGKSNNFTWAKLPDKEYDFKRKNFIELCRSCHTKMDMTEDGKRRISEWMKNHPEKNTLDPQPCFICKKIISAPHISQKYCDECKKEIYITECSQWQKQYRGKMNQYRLKWVENNPDKFKVNYQLQNKKRGIRRKLIREARNANK